MNLEVRYLGGASPEVVGQLIERKDGKVFFEYDSAWQVGRRELSPFYLPNSIEGAATTKTPLFGPLHGLFRDSLPDWWGEQLMKEHFRDKGIPWRGVTSLQRLACQGAFAMGALGFEPDLSDGFFRDVLTVEVAELVQSAIELTKGDSSEVIPALVRSGLSPGGAQPKVLLGFPQDFSQVVAGGGELPEGFTSWLLKFDLDPELEAGKEEFAYAAMARAAGIEMPVTRLLYEAERTHFLVRRFDRTEGGKRIHMHSYSGLTHTPVRDTIDYDAMLDTTRLLTRREGEVEKFFRRAVFNVVAGNDDDHGRNHSFLMDDEGEWTLSPAYDLTRTSNPLLGGMRSSTILGKGLGITRDDLKRLGDGQGVRKVDAVIDEVVAVVKEWPRWAREAGLSDFRTGQILDELELDVW